MIHDGDRVLFIGDSITDAGRNRNDPTDLSSGYVRYVADELQRCKSPASVAVLNRGVGGDRIADLRRRWSEDCLDLKPNVVSVLIGINDTWRRYDSGEITTLASYEADYRNVLNRLRATSDSELVLVEPFLLSVLSGQEAWRADLDPRIHAVSALAAEYKAVIVRADFAFQRAAQSVGATELADDGVHPTEMGHRLLAAEWLTAVGLGAGTD